MTVRHDPPRGRGHHIRSAAAVFLLTAALPLPCLALPLAPLPAADKLYEHALTAVLERAFPGEFGFDQGGAPPPGDNALLADVLNSPAFLHAAVGPLDVYVYKVDGFAAAPAAQHALDAAVAGLAPVGKLLAWRFPREHGLISGQRFPIVLASSDVTKKQLGFDQLIALLDWCDSGGEGGWIADNGTLWTDALRNALVVRTWTVQLFNLTHKDSTDQGSFFLEHGLGYYELAHLVNRLLRLGSWGQVPPWFDQGLIDELDIEAYGEAWVGGDWYVTETEGWFRPGWSGFVPQGQSPPPPVTGPPADLATTVRKTGDSWQHRANSTTRHWDNLAADRESAAPASFRFMADNESFLPRDRAYARCLMHLLLEISPKQGEALLTALDRQSARMPNGMFDTEPLPELVARALGGVPAVELLARTPLLHKLRDLEHEELSARLVALGAEPMLASADHRQAGDWLYGLPEIDSESRREIFALILTAEFHEQRREWLALSDVLDRAMTAAFEASALWPKEPAAQSKAAAAFSSALKS